MSEILETINGRATRPVSLGEVVLDILEDIEIS